MWCAQRAPFVFLQCSYGTPLCTHLAVPSFCLPWLWHLPGGARGASTFLCIKHACPRFGTFQGGAWCFSWTECVWRAGTPLGSSSGLRDPEARRTPLRSTKCRRPHVSLAYAVLDRAWQWPTQYRAVRGSVYPFVGSVLQFEPGARQCWGIPTTRPGSDDTYA